MKKFDFSVSNVIAWVGLIAALVFTFFIVYSPHFTYPFPYHIDEWHHISQAKRLIEGQYFQTQVASGFGVIEAGFHILLLLISKIFNLVLVYKYLPAIWATLTAGVIYFVISRKTASRLAGIVGVIFFASLKSNVNILGLWFFTPLTFSLPLVILYSYFLSEGVLQRRKKYIIISLFLMACLIPFYATGVLFLIPTMLIFFYFNREYIKTERKFFSIFLIIPVLGLAFYKMALGLPWLTVIDHLQQTLQFKYGWGVLEIKNQWTEMYSLVGYLMAVVGFLYVVVEKKSREYALYLIWPISLLVSIEIYRETGVSLLAPYQRNLYYFALIMPFFSALGVTYIIEQIKAWKLPREVYWQVVSLGIFLFLIIVGGLTFINYYRIPWQLDLYRVINKDNYETLLFMKTVPSGRVMATTFMGTALYPIASQQPYATIFFLGNPEVVEQFYGANSCEFRSEVIKNRKIKYVISPFPMDCGWPLIYDKKDKVYQVDQVYLGQDE